MEQVENLESRADRTLEKIVKKAATVSPVLGSGAVFAPADISATGSEAPASNSKTIESV
jgi:hypothetical protein